MPRRARIHLDGIPLHIVQRGHNREPCFFTEDDYAIYLHSKSKGPAMNLIQTPTALAQRQNRNLPGFA